VLAVAAPPAIAGSWLEFGEGFWPTEGSQPQLAMSPGGEAVVAYIGYGQSVDVKRHPPDGYWTNGFGEPVTGEELFLHPEAPSVAIDAAGDTVVVWQQQTGSGKTQIFASFRPAGGAFSIPAAISPEGASAPSVGIDEGGAATAVWLEDDGLDTVVEAAGAPRGGPFSAPVHLSGDGADAGSAQVAVAPGGEAVVSWTRTSGAGALLETAAHPRGGSFPGPDGAGDGAVVGESLAGTATPAAPPVQHVALDSAGEAVAVWRTAGSTVEAARMRAGRWTFGAPVALGTSAAYPWAAMDESGEAVADWIVPAGVAVVTAGQEASFGEAEEVPAREVTPERAKLVLDPNGAVTLVWQAERATGYGGAMQIEGGSVRPPGGRFPPSVEPASGVDEHAYSDLQLGGDALGDVVTVWQKNTKIGPEVVGEAYDAGPVIGALAVPATAAAGQPVTVQIPAPMTQWRPLEAVRWDFGDGATASGLSATHTYATPGVYRVTATANDDQRFVPGGFGGNVSNTATGTITVTAAVAPPVPEITRLGESHRVWREGSRLARIASARRAPVGTVFGFTLSEPGSLTLAFARRAPGRLHGGHCIAAASRRGGRRCVRSVREGTLSFRAHAGANRINFDGRLSRRSRLSLGSQTLTLTAVNAAGRPSPAASIRFTIVR
jgi:hypothetical protein